MERHERRAEAGREGRARLGDAALGAGDLGGVAREEVVDRLLGRQPRERRQHAEGIGGEEHHGLRHAADAARRNRRQRLERIGGAGVLGQRDVVEIGHAVRAEHEVLEHRARSDCAAAKISGSLSALQLHRLGVAAALEIEDAVRGPAVLVVADQRPRRDRSRASSCRCPRGRRTARRRRRARHWPSSASGSTPRARRVEVEQREHRLLDLAGIGGAADDDDVARACRAR